jgi:hypothetical protein
VPARRRAGLVNDRIDDDQFVSVARTHARTHARRAYRPHGAHVAVHVVWRTSQMALRVWQVVCTRTVISTHLVCGRPDVRYTRCSAHRTYTEGPSGRESAIKAYRLLDCCASE